MLEAVPTEEQLESLPATSEPIPKWLTVKGGFSSVSHSARYRCAPSSSGIVWEQVCFPSVLSQEVRPMATNLVLHRGARLVERPELDAVEAPPGTNTWFPVSHSTVLSRVEETLHGSGFSISRTALALTADNLRFFATLDLQSSFAEGVTLTVGVRNSNDKSFPIGMVAGNRVFVCDNLAFSSEIFVVRKHTRFGEVRFNEAIAKAVQSLHQYQDVAAKRISWMQARNLTDDEANSLILQSAEIVGWRTVPKVVEEWRKPQHEEFAPRSAWSLLNAFTECLKEHQLSQPQRAALETIRLQKLLAPDVIDVQATAV